MEEDGQPQGRTQGWKVWVQVGQREEVAVRGVDPDSDVDCLKRKVRGDPDLRHVLGAIPLTDLVLSTLIPAPFLLPDPSSSTSTPIAPSSSSSASSSPPSTNSTSGSASSSSEQSLSSDDGGSGIADHRGHGRSHRLLAAAPPHPHALPWVSPPPIVPIPPSDAISATSSTSAIASSSSSSSTQSTGWAYPYVFLYAPCPFPVARHPIVSIGEPKDVAFPTFLLPASSPLPSTAQLGPPPSAAMSHPSAPSLTSAGSDQTSDASASVENRDGLLTLNPRWTIRDVLRDGATVFVSRIAGPPPLARTECAADVPTPAKTSTPQRQGTSDCAIHRNYYYYHQYLFNDEHRLPSVNSLFPLLLFRERAEPFGPDHAVRREPAVSGDHPQRRGSRESPQD
jgi:hypothetical protein